MINKQFFKDFIDEFLYVWMFGKRWNAEEAEEQRLSKLKNQDLSKRIKQRKRLKWIRKRTC